jgi:hypothetical protein
LATSVDGSGSWTGKGAVLQSSWAVAGGATYAEPTVTTPLYVAVGYDGNTLAISTDGINWVGHYFGVYNTGGYDIVNNGSIWVSAGEGTLNTLATSTNGFTWSGLGKTVFTTRANKLYGGWFRWQFNCLLFEWNHMDGGFGGEFQNDYGRKRHYIRKRNVDCSGCGWKHDFN